MLMQHVCAVLSLVYLAYRHNLRSCRCNGLCVCLRCRRKACLLSSMQEGYFIDVQEECFPLTFYIAQELELLEQRGQGIKTKAETQAKYGW